MNNNRQNPKTKTGSIYKWRQRSICDDNRATRFSIGSITSLAKAGDVCAGDGSLRIRIAVYCRNESFVVQFRIDKSCIRSLGSLSSTPWGSEEKLYWTLVIRQNIFNKFLQTFSKSKDRVSSAKGSAHHSTSHFDGRSVNDFDGKKKRCRARFKVHKATDDPQECCATFISKNKRFKRAKSKAPICDENKVANELKIRTKHREDYGNEDKWLAII